MRVRSIVDRDEFDPQFDYIKEPLGGYGLDYRSTMEKMDVLAVAGPTSGFPFRRTDAGGQASRGLRPIEHTAVDQRIAGHGLSDFAEDLH